MVEDSAVRVAGLRKRYGDVIAVDGVSFEARRGEIFGLLGPNGAGKTTTFECLEGIRRPDEGGLEVLGIDPHKDPRALGKVMGIQLQTSGLPADMLVDEAMRFFSAYHGVAPRYEVLDRMGLGEKRGATYRSLSTGQQRRLTLALAVAHEPEVVVLDEPTAGLDVATRAELHAMMAELRGRGTTILLATHDMAEAEKLADRVAILLRGRIVALDTPRKLTAAGPDLTKITVRTDSERDLTQTSLPHVVRSLRADSYSVFFSEDAGATVVALIRSIESAGEKLADLRVERPTLEERFLELTQDGGLP
ncbi:MAG TPA: ABC transporter ATP-binding protein [Anaerolineales bacterium]|nr:ABC transporter ATP-binding protein [Anaerolineales bacterium]